MDIHFVSTLTPEDEDQYAPAVLSAVKALLDLVPITYTLRIDTTSGRVFHQARTDIERGADEIDAEPAAFVPGRVTFS